MSLINCPECGNECSATATACPHCGHPFVKPVVQPRVVVKEVPREDSFPKWIFIPIALLGVVILFFIFMMLKGDDDKAQKNSNVNIVTTTRQSGLANTTTTTTTIPTTSQPSTIIAPSTSQPSTVTVPPPTIPPATTTTTATVAEPTPSDKASVNVEAKVMSRTGNALPVTKEKFYLLDKDLESILAEAKIQDDTGQGLINAFGASVVNPAKYRDTNQKALAAIKRHIVYSTLTDAAGKAQLKDVKPKSYYLFGITKTGNGFAVWNSPVNVNAGQNSLILDPATPTEIIDTSE